MADDQARYNREKVTWDSAMERWNRLYYCHRDGVVLDPQLGKILKPDQVRDYVCSVGAAEP